MATTPSIPSKRRNVLSGGRKKTTNGDGGTAAAESIHDAGALIRALKAAQAGDFSVRLDARGGGANAQVAQAFNALIERNHALELELERLNTSVGRQGKLNERASMGRAAEGGWANSIRSVNNLIGHLVQPMNEVSRVITAVARGDLTQTMVTQIEGRPLRGEFRRTADTVNQMVGQLGTFASEVTRVAREVGTEGKLGGQARVKGVAGTWKDLTDNVNSMAENLTSQVRNIAEVTTAVANGDLSRKITVEVRGEILELKNTINRMVDQLNAFASEVTRVAREVGTEGKLGGQAQVRGVAGIWKDLTDNVNTMAENLTAQVRGIARVVTAVARGDLKRKLGLEAKGEIAVLADTINDMIDTLALFADQVTSVAREVGVEGRLGGQAQVPGASGTWRDLTDNVNQLAANLTTQVRAIAEVATAVTEGDLTRSIAVEARGEVAALKDNINEMIRNLKETTQKNQEQDWLNSNLARIGRNLQGQRDRQTVCRLILSELARLVDAQHGAFFVQSEEAGETFLTMQASYAYKERKSPTNRFRLGEALVGQAALERERILLTNVPADYVNISSGLGEAKPLNIVVLPVLFEDHIKAVIELASFSRFSDVHLAFLEQLGESIGIVLNTIEATMRTEQLLRQSQSLTERLQSQQEELQQTNEELEEKARLLTEQKAQVEVKNREVELARQALEEKAEQLALTSKYKSEFLANMSHELRTPLNSLLVLARLLAENNDANLSDKQVEYARTIHSSGTDLLGLINEILDLSKIESGKMAVDVTDVSLKGLASDLENLFRELAEDKHLRFDVHIDERLPRTIETDGKRLKQVLRNLLSNSFKFTETGSVELMIAPAASGWSDDRPALDRAGAVLAFSVRDTGIGIAKDKQKVIFEAFQQADGTTSRKYGGTGLGLSISREIAFLLGGDIRVDSELGQGTTFTLFLPAEFPEGQAKFSKDDDGSEHGIADDSVRMRVQSLRRIEQPTGPGLLISVADDGRRKRLLELAQREGWRGIPAPYGGDAPTMARRARPAAILLDLEDTAGWPILDSLKRDPGLRQVPVLALCGESAARAQRMGAKACIGPDDSDDAVMTALKDIREFTSRSTKRLLIVEDDERASGAMVELCEMDGVEISTAPSAARALELLREQPFDCIVADLGLPDMEGLEFLEKLANEPAHAGIPVIVHTGRELSRAEENRLRRVAETIVLKDARSPERLLAEVTLYLHRPQAQLSVARRQMLEEGPKFDPVLQGGRVLIVDDDVRNVFALTSALEQQGMVVSFAENGREALEKLEEGENYDMVLMDIMMPEMDGFATMRAIREKESLRDIPIVALTAKAMQGDREACLEAGANDYITKPVDLDQLLSLMRVWLFP